MWKSNYSKEGVGIKQKANAGYMHRLLEVRRNREKRAVRIKNAKIARRTRRASKKYLKEAKMMRRLRPSTAKT